MVRTSDFKGESMGLPPEPAEVEKNPWPSIADTPQKRLWAAIQHRRSLEIAVMAYQPIANSEPGELGQKVRQFIDSLLSMKDHSADALPTALLAIAQTKTAGTLATVWEDIAQKRYWPHGELEMLSAAFEVRKTDLRAMNK